MCHEDALYTVLMVKVVVKGGITEVCYGELDHCQLYYVVSRPATFLLGLEDSTGIPKP
jgi:hypothetical protein